MGSEAASVIHTTRASARSCPRAPQHPNLAGRFAVDCTDDGSVFRANQNPATEAISDAFWIRLREPDRWSFGSSGDGSFGPHLRASVEPKTGEPRPFARRPARQTGCAREKKVVNCALAALRIQGLQWTVETRGSDGAEES